MASSVRDEAAPDRITKIVLWRAVDVNRPVMSLLRSWCDAGRAGTNRYRGLNIPRTPFLLFSGDGENFNAIVPEPCARQADQARFHNCGK